MRVKSHEAFELETGEYEAQLMQGLALSGESKEYFARGRLDFLRAWWDRSGRPEPTSVIDLGSGIGDVTALLAEVFPQASVTGIEPSERCREVATRFEGPRVRFLGADAEVEPADLVHLSGVVHHVPPPERSELFARVRELTRAEGVAAVFDNNPLNPGTRLVMKRIPFDRDAVLTPSWEVRRRFRQAGFDPLATRYLFWFPRLLSPLRVLEPRLARLPMGAQYVVLAHARHPSQVSAETVGQETG